MRGRMQYSSQRKRIALVVAHLGPGGAQRVMSTAANELASRGVDVHVITILDGPGDAYELDSRVRRHRCGGAKDKSVNPVLTRWHAPAPLCPNARAEASQACSEDFKYFARF